MGLLTTLKPNDVFRDEFSVAFDGSNDYVDCGSSFDLADDDFTILGWIKASDLTSNPVISQYADSANRWFLWFDASDRLQFFSKIANSTIISVIGTAQTSLENTWIHFAFSADRSGGNQAMYINGVLNQTDADASTTSLSPAVTNLHIGRYHTTYSNSNISEVAIYNSALTANQVKTIYNGREPYNHKKGVASGNLQAWYRMGDSDLNPLDPNSANILIPDETNITLGSNLVTNGTFASDSDWTKGTGWSIGSGVASASSVGMSNILSQDISAVTGKIYRVSFDITARSGGSVILVDIGSSVTANNIVIAVSTGHRTIYVKAAGSDLLIAGMSFGLDFSGSIDNVKVQQLGGNAGLGVSLSLESFEGDTP